MPDELENELSAQLFTAILLLENKEECISFFKDIATAGEIKELSHRLEVARMLRNNYTYNEIVEHTGVSTTTISRVKRVLEYGAGGYDLVLDKMEQIDE